MIVLILRLIVFCRRIDFYLRVFFLVTNKLVRTRGDVSSEVGDVVWLITALHALIKWFKHGEIPDHGGFQNGYKTGISA